MFDRHDSNAAFDTSKPIEAVVLVHLNFNDRNFDESEQEFIELVNSTGARIARISPVLAITRHCSFASKFLSWLGDNSWLK